MLTSYAAERARRQISGLLNLNQRFVWLVDGGVEKKVPVESLKAGDMIAAHAGEMICIDGRVLEGSAAVNQSSITGESNPAMKQEKSRVYAGSVVEAGELTVMLTGDSKEVAAQVAQEMDIDSFYAEVLPEDKANYVQKLKERGCIMMVGDGINDAPALAFANVGVSLGGQQTDIAAESGAVTIRSEDPEGLMTALSIGRRTMSLIRQNFTATITVNSAAMLLGALGKINPLWAAIIHNTATLAVVLNSARILGSGKKKFLPHIGLF